MRKQLTKESVEKYLEEFKVKLFKKLEQKGYGGFINPQEIIGKMEEERHEAIIEMHARNMPKFCEELEDISIVTLFGSMSIRDNKELYAKTKKVNK